MVILIYNSSVNDFKNYYSDKKISESSHVFKLNNGDKQAFVIFSSLNEIPKIYNDYNYPLELLEKELYIILDTYYIKNQEVNVCNNQKYFMQQNKMKIINKYNIKYKIILYSLMIIFFLCIIVSISILHFMGW